MMTEQELEHSRQLYKHYVQKKEKYISLKKEIASLERNPMVKLYLDLTSLTRNIKSIFQLFFHKILLK